MASSDFFFNVDNGYLEGLVRGFRGGDSEPDGLPQFDTMRNS